MTDLIPLDQRQELASARESSPLDLAIASWLHAKSGRSGSLHTRRIYQETIADFRAQLHAAGLDLDAAPNHITLVSITARKWLFVTFGESGGSVPTGGIDSSRSAFGSGSTARLSNAVCGTRPPRCSNDHQK